MSGLCWRITMHCFQMVDCGRVSLTSSVDDDIVPPSLHHLNEGDLLMKFVWEVLKGMVIGLANIIPGVSGGTMMVSMGIYDQLIYSINHLFTSFKKSIRFLFPYVLGMLVAIGALSFALKWAFQQYPLPTNTLFIGLILGGLPAILRQIKGEKIGVPGIILFLLAFALIIVLPLMSQGTNVHIQLSVLEVIKLFLIGVLASATMVIPGVSGSMVLKIIGYYEPLVTGALPDLIKGLSKFDMGLAGPSIGMLLPFAVGIVVGILAIAKLIEVLLAKWKGYTYSAIIGLVAASPVAILMGTAMAGVTWVMILVSVVTFAVGFLVAWKLSEKG